MQILNIEELHNINGGGFSLLANFKTFIKVLRAIIKPIIKKY